MGKDLVEVGSERDLGPAMKALNPRQRKFVTAVVAFGVSHAKAYEIAGYKSDNEDSVSAASARLAHMDCIQRAIEEEIPRRLKAHAPLAIKKLIDLQNKAEDKVAIAAANSLLDRAGVSAKSEVKHTVAMDTESLDDLLAYIRSNARRIAQTDPEALIASASEVVDAEYEEVVEETGLEDLL